MRCKIPSPTAEKPFLTSYDSWRLAHAKRQILRSQLTPTRATAQPYRPDLKFMTARPLWPQRFEVNESLRQLLATYEKTKQAVVRHHLEGNRKRMSPTCLIVRSKQRRIQFGVVKCAHMPKPPCHLHGLLAMLFYHVMAMLRLVPVAALGTPQSQRLCCYPRKRSRKTSQAQQSICLIHKKGNDWSTVRSCGVALKILMNAVPLKTLVTRFVRMVRPFSKKIGTANPYTQHAHGVFQSVPLHRPATFDFGTGGNHDMKVLIGYVDRPEDGTALFTHGDNRDLMHRARLRALRSSPSAMVVAIQASPSIITSTRPIIRRRPALSNCQRMVPCKTTGKFPSSQIRGFYAISPPISPNGQISNQA